jgi:hypothetical protein
MFQTKGLEKIKKSIVCSIIFPKNQAFYDNIEKYRRGRQVTDGNTIQYNTVQEFCM